MNSLNSSENEFLTKLTELIETNLTNPQFGVSMLARELGISRSTLHRKVFLITKLSVSQFINQVRLHHAMEILRHTSNTVSEVAHKIGFSSTSYFIKCFHEYYGYPPGDVGERDKDDNESSHSDQPKKKKLILIFALFAVVVIVAHVLVIVYKPFSSTKNNIVNSIAVLPPSIICTDSTYYQLLDGTAMMILDNLSIISDMKKVIPWISVQQYRNSKKTAVEIAKDLGVSYIITSLGIVLEDSILFNIRLIDGKEGNQLKYCPYKIHTKEFIKLPMNIATVIAHEINAEITQAEKERIEKIPTNNLEAYKLYLEGRFFWNKRTEDGIKKSLELFTEAIRIDSNYALAWSGLADAYHILSGWGYYTPKKEGEANAKYCAKKALELNNNLAEAHATLGFLLSYTEWNWDEAEKELIEAIRLNPNYAFAHHIYSLLLDIQGNHLKACEENDLALKLDPLSPILHYERATFYYNEKKFNESLMECQEIIALEHLFPPTHWWLFKNYYRLGYGEEALKELQIILQLDTLTENYGDAAEKIYMESGFKGLIDWIIEITNEVKQSNPDMVVNLYWEGYLTELYAISGHKEEALDLLEYYLNTNTEGDRLVRLINNLDYETIYTEQRFKKIVNKLGLMEYYKNTLPPYKRFIK